MGKGECVMGLRFLAAFLLLVLASPAISAPEGSGTAGVEIASVDLYDVIRNTPRRQLNRQLQKNVKVRTNIQPGPFMYFYRTSRAVNKTGKSMNVDMLTFVKTEPNQVRINDARGKWAGTGYIGKDKDGNREPFRRTPTYFYLKCKKGSVRIVCDMYEDKLVVSPDLTSNGVGLIHTYLVGNDGTVLETNSRTSGYQTKIEGISSLRTKTGETCEIKETRLFGYTIYKSIECDEETDK